LDKDKDNSPFLIRNALDILKKKLLFKDVIGGRPNIYSLFIKKSIDELDTNGVLCYVIPTSLLSSKYFEKTRDYIIKYCNIERIEKLNTNDFDGAQQKTMIFQIKKRKSGNNNKNFVVKLGSGIIFTPDSDTINKILIDKSFIKTMGCSVKTGNVVWNQFRDKNGDLFTNDPDGNTMLVYPRNLTTGILVADSNKKKFQYIKSNHETIPGPVIAINRIIGMNSISLNPVLIESGSYYFENHINIITGPLDKLKIILESLKNQETIDFIKMIIGNTQLSKTELETMIPIKI
jgi:adenine-specific DNA-methyltransferase